MSNTCSQLIDVLLHGRILHAPALAFKRLGFYADMALVTTRGSVRILGEGFDMPDGEEFFFLNLGEFQADAYWHDKQGRPAWPPRQAEDGGWSALDLVSEFKRFGLHEALESNRQVKFYRNPDAIALGLGSRGPLQSASAVSLAGSGLCSERLLVYATPELPSSLEIILEGPRLLAVIAGLEEFQPGGWLLSQ
jgi:hypothetical protein